MASGSDIAADLLNKLAREKAARDQEAAETAAQLANTREAIRARAKFLTEVVRPFLEEIRAGAGNQFIVQGSEYSQETHHYGALSFGIAGSGLYTLFASSPATVRKSFGELPHNGTIFHQQIITKESDLTLENVEKLVRLILEL